MLLAHETTATIDDNGILWPSRLTLYSVMAMQSELNGRMLETIRELAGGAMFTVPSSVRDFDNPEAARDIERYMRAASTGAKERIALLRHVWDFIGTEFGSRHQQYEKFYGGAAFLIKQNVNRYYDYKRATALVDKALAMPPIEGSGA
jgi:4-hydroxyphenylacetate 3-monooxygenase